MVVFTSVNKKEGRVAEIESSLNVFKILPTGENNF